MTSVCYDREGLRLTMEGHAGAGIFGSDPVCAALSMLMMTLQRRMEDRAEEALPVISRGPGHFEIQCEPVEEAEALCRESFDTAAAGFALLAENRPEFVSFRVTEDTEEEDEE